jgi:hypothetical protein
VPTGTNPIKGGNPLTGLLYHVRMKRKDQVMKTFICRPRNARHEQWKRIPDVLALDGTAYAPITESSFSPDIELPSFLRHRVCVRTGVLAFEVHVIEQLQAPQLKCEVGGCVKVLYEMGGVDRTVVKFGHRSVLPS